MPLLTALLNFQEPWFDARVQILKHIHHRHPTDNKTMRLWLTTEQDKRPDTPLKRITNSDKHYKGNNMLTYFNLQWMEECCGKFAYQSSTI